MRTTEPKRRKSSLDQEGFERARTVGAALVGVALHLEVAVLGAEVDVGGEHHLYVLLLLGQRPRGLSSRCRHGWSGARASGWRREGEEEGRDVSGGANREKGREIGRASCRERVYCTV